MKLHPVTQLIVFALVLRLAADTIFLANTVYAITSPSIGVFPLAAGFHFLGLRFQEFAQTLSYAGLAVWVEVLSRWACRLRSDRLTRTQPHAGISS